MRKIFKSTQGVTLVALVVTIIVLLILAGISINMITGQNSLIGSTQNATDSERLSEAREALELAVIYAEGKGSKYLDDTADVIDNAVTKLKRDGYSIVETENTNPIKGIDIDKEEISVITEESEKIKITIQENTSSKLYYMAVNGRYYQITENKGNIRLASEETPRTVVEAPATEPKIYNMVVTSSDTSQTNLIVSYNNTKKEVTVTGVKESDDPITVTIKYGTASNPDEFVKTCSVSVMKNLVIAEKDVIGDYVDYNVAYQDNYTSYNFTKTNGWRILSLSKNNSLSTTEEIKYDIKLISTGVPVRLNYQYDQNIGNSNNGWWGTDAQVRELYGQSFVDAGYIHNDVDNTKNGYPNYYAATGLLKNFESIVFVPGNTASNNGGVYRNINGTTTGNLTGAVFRVNSLNSKITDIHVLTLEELNQARGKSPTSTDSLKASDQPIGLFYLNVGNYNYNTDGRYLPFYWLATPYTGSRDALIQVYGGGNNNTQNIDNVNGGRVGLRPVITITGVTMTQNENTLVWTIE